MNEQNGEDARIVAASPVIHESGVLPCRIVIRDLGERGDGPWVLRLPIRKSCFCALRLTDIKARKWWAVEARLFCCAVGLPAIASGGYIGGREIDHDHPAVGRQSPQNVVRHISRMIDESPGVRM